MNRWVTKKIADIADVVAGGTPSTNNSEFWNGNIGWITPADLSGYKYRYIANGARNITKAGLNNSSAYLLPKNTILLSSRAPIGYVAIAGKELATNQGFKNLICDDTQIDYRFMYYWLQLNADALKCFASGATFPELSAGTVKKIKVTLPDMVTQNRITDILFAYDELIEANTRRIELLEQTTQELYKEWFVRFRFPGYENAKFENGLPEGWKIKRMNEFCYVTDGTHDTPKPVDVGVPLVTGRCISSGFVDFDAAYNISEADHKGIKKRSGLKSGDILFSNIGTVGNCCIVDYDREFSVKNVIIFKPETMRDTAYLYYWMTSSTMQEVFGAQTNGASQQFVGLTFMRRYKLLVPKDDILEVFADKVLPIVEQKRLLHQKNLNLAAQRDMLLPRLMSGKLEV